MKDETPHPTPQHVKDETGMVHSYWANCDGRWKTAVAVADDEPLSCLFCIAAVGDA